MPSIGNDIVDISLINKDKAMDAKFYSKILCPSELKMYQKIENKISFEIYLWLLWSVKESVFKYLSRNINPVIFSPTKIKISRIELPAHFDNSKNDFHELIGQSVEGHNFIKCLTNFDNIIIPSSSIINNLFISTFAYDEGDARFIDWGIKSIELSDYEFQTRAIRDFF